MGIFKDNYYEEKSLLESYRTKLIEKGYVLNDSDLIDDEYLEEDNEICTECIYTDIDVIDTGNLNERLFKKIVVRQGKKVKKWISSDPRKKIKTNPTGGKPTEVVKKSAERIARKKGSMRGKIKRKAKSAQIKIKSRISRLKRKMFGLK